MCVLGEIPGETIRNLERVEHRAELLGARVADHHAGFPDTRVEMQLAGGHRRLVAGRERDVHLVVDKIALAQRARLDQQGDLSNRPARRGS